MNEATNGFSRVVDYKGFITSLMSFFVFERSRGKDSRTR